MRSVTIRRVRLARVLMILAVAAAALEACGPGRTVPYPATSALVVHNQSHYDVNVYTVPSAGSRPVRLGTVFGSMTERFELRPRHLQPGDVLVVQVHPIGSNESWTSPSVNVGDDVVAALEVNANAYGDCSLSVLSTLVGRILVPPGR